MQGVIFGAIGGVMEAATYFADRKHILRSFPDRIFISIHALRGVKGRRVPCGPSTGSIRKRRGFQELVKMIRSAQDASEVGSSQRSLEIRH